MSKSQNRLSVIIRSGNQKIILSGTVTGVGLAIGAIAKFKEHKENPTIRVTTISKNTARRLIK